MKFIRYIIVLFFIIHSTSSLATEQSEEGWRWKKTFLLQAQDDSQHCVDNLHDQMADMVKSIHQQFSDIAQSSDVVIANLRKFLLTQKNEDINLIFKNLNAKIKNLNEKNESERKSIDDILKEDRLGQLEKYWFVENVDAQTLPKTNDLILHIIKKNIKRLCTRNIVIAEIGTLIGGEYKSIPILEPTTKRRAVFLSSTGNRLIELLEPICFPEFTFITFDRPYNGDKLYDGFLKGNLGYVLSHTSERIPESLKQKSVGYKKEIDTYVSAQRDLEKKLGAYNKCVQKVAKTQPIELNISQITDSILRQSQEKQREHLQLSIELGSNLQDMQTSYLRSLKLIPDFFHSEQILRLFLYNNLELLVDQSFGLDAIAEFLTIHIHSSNDVCERCTHCLFLESEMCNVNTEDNRPAVKGKKTKDPYGFFERLSNSLKDKKSNLQYQILATSSNVGEQRGVMHRYQAGHDMYADKPINLNLFPPLLAFKVIPYEFILKPLPPFLLQSQVVGSLHQTYFPTLEK